MEQRIAINTVKNEMKERPGRRNPLTESTERIVRRQYGDNGTCELPQESAPCCLVNQLNDKRLLQLGHHVVDDVDGHRLAGFPLEEDHISGGHAVVLTWRGAVE